LPPLDEEADQEPADDADEGADHTGKKAIDVHTRPRV